MPSAYVGALLGPLGGGVLAPMLPQVGESLQVSAGAVATSITTYFVPFAVIQLISGTLGERWGRRRTVRAAYLVYALGSLVCAFAPSFGTFLLARAVMGAANAFTGPLLVAGLADLVPRERLSRSVGVISSWMAAGQSVAPFVGGVAAAGSWRFAFVIVAAVAVLLSLSPPPGEPRPGTAAPSWRSLLRRDVGLLAVGGFVSYLGAAALPFMVALYLNDSLHVGPGLTGVALLGFGVAGLLLGPAWGSLNQRFGARMCGVVAAVATAAFVALVGVTGTAWTLALCWTAAGAASSMLTIALQNLTVRAVRGNRGGVLSVVSAFRFAGAALAPAAWLPLYHGGGVTAFAVAGASVLLALPVLAVVGGHDRG
ncbi:MFS transporter [Streptosporangium sp. NPDC048865]|uniref:MFS transporter n=1 Tax=Streptosporangium sp. NPDC048865 TaxID=3155766 RepID=UPI00344AB26F